MEPWSWSQQFSAEEVNSPDFGLARGPVPGGNRRTDACLNCVMVHLVPGEQICTRDYPPEIAFHPARLARLAYGTPPPLVLFEIEARV